MQIGVTSYNRSYLVDVQVHYNIFYLLSCLLFYLGFLFQFTLGGFFFESFLFLQSKLCFTCFFTSLASVVSITLIIFLIFLALLICRHKDISILQNTFYKSNNHSAIYISVIDGIMIKDNIILYLYFIYFVNIFPFLSITQSSIFKQNTKVIFLKTLDTPFFYAFS